MIAFLTGKLLEKSANAVIIDVGGVGYEVLIPLSTFYELGEPGTDVKLRIHTHVREDAIQLYGFNSQREKDLYLRVISVQGIGARSGLTLALYMYQQGFNQYEIGYGAAIAYLLFALVLILTALQFLLLAHLSCKCFKG